MGEVVVCRICKTKQPVNARRVIRPHGDPLCDGSFKPRAWGLATEPEEK
jgi:hypothetical protein